MRGRPVAVLPFPSANAQHDMEVGPVLYISSCWCHFCLAAILAWPTSRLGAVSPNPACPASTQPIHRSTLPL